MPEFTIILPVYNAEKTLDRCLQSIQMQSFGDFEVIMVDDGSKDNSQKLCQEYAKKDKRFRYYYQENAGPSLARNKGLDVAKGTYIAFVDSDDFLENDYLKSIKKVYETESVETVFIGYRKISHNQITDSICVPDVKTSDFYSVLVELSKKDLFGYAWIKSFSRKIIGDCHFREDINLFEDEIFTCEVLQHCNQIGFVREPIYNYVTDNENALTGRTHQDYCYKRNQVFLAWQRLLTNFRKRDAILARIANNALVTCKYYCLERNVDIKAFTKELSQCDFLDMATEELKFKELIKALNYQELKKMRFSYRIKVGIAKLLRK